MKRISYTQYKLILNTIFLVGLTSVFFVYPFDNHFRFTFGVVVLATLLLYFPKLPIITTAALSGLLIMATRIGIYILADASRYDLFSATLLSLPAFCYYFFFGILFYYLETRKSIRNIPVTFLKLSFIDFFSNVLELAIRHTFSISESVGLLPSLVGIAIIRTLLAIYCYYALRRYRRFILAEEHVQRYSQLIMVFAELKTEMYYLQKSSKDIEAVMARSFLLYQRLDSSQPDGSPTKEETAGELLQIARDIHEVKKDYYRIMKGMEDMLSYAKRENGMSISDIFYMIEQNTLRFLSNAKAVGLKFTIEQNFTTPKHYAIISILNNLIINAIEACDNNGEISVSQSCAGSDIVFRVEDNGCGIDPEYTGLIFNPGYSTKYSADTGKVSTGLGLVHVKNLAESMDGKVCIDSRPGQGTAVSVVLPLGKLA